MYTSKYENLSNFYPRDEFGYAMIFGTLYPLSSGTSHSAQYGLYGILKAVNDGDYNFREDVKIYGEKAKVMKKLFTENGFSIVYDKDEGEPIADGFYFTFAYQGFNGVELLNKLVYYGISAIALAITGSERHEGVRACVSLVKDEQFADLEYRLKQFNKDYPIG